MSDGHCHRCPEKQWNGTHYQHFSQSETVCRRCGAAKWLWSDGATRTRLHLIAMYIAAFERGRAARMA